MFVMQPDLVILDLLCPAKRVRGVRRLKAPNATFPCWC
jgi:hypothetical protein